MDNQKILYVVTAGTDSSFSNRMLRMIRNEEEEHPEETLPGGIRLGLCSANGNVNDWLFKIGSLVVIIEVVQLIGRMGLAFFS